MARNKGFDTATGEYYIKIFAVTNLKVVPRVMAHYCKHDNSATTAAYNPHKWEGSVEIFSYAEKYIKKYRPEWSEKYQKIWDYYAYRFIWTVVKMVCMIKQPGNMSPQFLKSF